MKNLSLFADQSIAREKRQPRVQAEQPRKQLAPFSRRLLSRPTDLFLFLTRWTCPHGGEGRYYHKALSAMGFKDDRHGNYFLTIGEGPTTAFMAHLDTADHASERITHVITEGVCRTDGTTLLGADDRSGVTILLHMASESVHGRYCLFVGEECGCIGSSASAADRQTWKGIERAVSFDRRGQTSIVTHQCGERTCSEVFAVALAERLNEHGFQFAADNNGVFTDSREFAGIVPECTNLSVGYEHAHSTRETQDLAFLMDLAQACCRIDWEGLPTMRQPTRSERWQDWGRNGSDDLGWAEPDSLTWRAEEEAISLLARQFLSGGEFDYSALVALCEGDSAIAYRMEALLQACREGIFG
jgi:hypothetical protein